MKLRAVSELSSGIRAAVPKLSLRSHVLAEAAKLVELEKPGEVLSSL